MICFDIDRSPLGAVGALGAKKLGEKSQKVHKTMANLSLQKFRLGSSILPGSSFRPEPGKQAAELQIDTQKRLPTLALFPNGLPSGYLDPTGNLALNQFPENQLNQKPFTMLVEEGTFISNHKGELLNSKNE